MDRLRSPWTRAFLAWTAALAFVAVILFVAAVVGFLGAADACYFQIGPCAQAGDANFALLQSAVFGIPMVWLVGVLVGVAARAVVRRRRTPVP
jgi:hypothetical protein